jgi:pyruvate kinase
VALIHAASADQPNRLPVPHQDFFHAAPLSSGEIVLNDAKVRLRIESLAAETLHARVIQGGAVASRKGVTYTASTYRQESLGEMDRAVLARMQHLPDIQYALSYVKDAQEMAGYRDQIGRGVVAIAKLERPSALGEAARIAEAADALWLCRGDLGAEVGVKAMAEAVYRLSAGVQAMPVPVLLAGQVFEHMTEHPTPTRSEVCGVYEALMKGYRGVVLSDETAIGRDPVESCRMAALFRT